MTQSAANHSLRLSTAKFPVKQGNKGEYSGFRGTLDLGQ